MKHSNQVTSSFSTAHDSEEIQFIFKCGLLDAIQEHIPHKNSSPKPSLPWINAEIKKMIPKHDRLYRRLKKTGNRALQINVKKLKHEIHRKTRRSF